MDFTPEQIKEMALALDETKKELENARKEMDLLKNGKPEENEDLLAKAKKSNAEADKNSAKLKQLESSVKFNYTIADFFKSNLDILPNDIETILKVAEKENYDTAVDKANAIKVGVISSFFSTQSNLDTLTQAQKIQLEDFMKLTKHGKEERAAHVYENILEPSLEMVRKLKKVEEIVKSRNGISNGTLEELYKEKMIKASNKTHLRVQA